MLQEIVFFSLTPEIQKTLEYIGSAATGGIIGNRADNWFMGLFYHQRKRILDWIKIWNPNTSDLNEMLESEELRILFSKIIYDVSNEMDSKKLELWPFITDSVVRNKYIPIDKKKYYISLFNKLDSFALEYLAILYNRVTISQEDIFNTSGEQPQLGSFKHTLYLGQLQCSTTGLTDFTRDSKSNFYLTELGKEFVDFIANNSFKNN